MTEQPSEQATEQREVPGVTNPDAVPAAGDGEHDEPGEGPLPDDDPQFPLSDYDAEAEE